MNPDHTYRDAPSTGDREELLAKPGAGSPAQDDEAHWHTPSPWAQRQAKQSGLVSFLKEYWWCYTTGLLVCIVGLQLAIWHDIRAASPASSWQVGGDYQRKGPIFSTDIVKWKADPEFTPLNASAFLDPKVQAKWETLYPEGAGFVGAEDSILVYNSTSVTHQLHCVYIMGKIFSAVLTKAADIPEPEDYEAHFLHCVDYMRQAAMCAGDLAIEPRGENGEPGPVNLENAFNGLHVCKDYSQVRNYLTEQVKAGARNILPLDD